MENGTGLLIEPKQKRWKEILDKLNSYVALLTLGMTLGVGITSTLIKAIMYTYEWGKLSYWGINTSYIDILKGNRLYDLFFYIALTILILAANILPYKILTSKKKVTIRILQVIAVILFLGFAYWLYLIISVCRGFGTNSFSQMMENKKLLIYLATGSFFLSFFTLLFGLFFGVGKCIEKWRRKKRERSSKERTKDYDQKYEQKRPFILMAVVFLGVYFAVCILMAYWMGYCNARERKEYKLIGEDQVILCEGEDFFLTAKSEVIDKENQKILVISPEIQTEISKAGMMTTRVNFDKVQIAI